MSGKIDRLLEKKYGFDASEWEPRPTGAKLQHLLSYYRSGAAKRAEEVVFLYRRAHEIDNYRVYGTGVEAQEPYTIVARKYKDGSTDYAFIWGCCADEEKIAEIGQKLSSDSWFQMDDGAL